MLFWLLICRCSSVVSDSFGTSKFKSVSDRQDVGALMCSVFRPIHLDLHYSLYRPLFVFSFLPGCVSVFQRHYAFHSAIAPEFFYFSYMCLFDVCALGC